MSKRVIEATETSGFRPGFIGLLTLGSFTFLCSCVQKMGKEGHFRPLEEAPALSLISRMPPIGTVPQEQDPQNSEVNTKPPQLTRKILQSGREQYQVFCMPCHGMSGYGNGMIVQRGFLAPPSFHQDRLRDASDQHFYDVITHGFGAMYSYSDRIPPSERWAIISYIRVLQLSQNTHVQDLNAEDRKQLENSTPPSKSSGP